VRHGEEVSYIELATLASAPFWARRHTIAALTAWQVSPETIKVAELLVSELATNAIKVSCPELTRLPYSSLDGVVRICLTLRLLPGRVVIEVFDNDPRPPVKADADTDAENGRGLMLVDALSKEWGYYFPPAGGKTVFCVIDAAETIGRSANEGCAC